MTGHIPLRHHDGRLAEPAEVVEQRRADQLKRQDQHGEEGHAGVAHRVVVCGHDQDAPSTRRGESRTRRPERSSVSRGLTLHYLRGLKNEDAALRSTNPRRHRRPVERVPVGPTTPPILCRTGMGKTLDTWAGGYGSGAVCVKATWAAGSTRSTVPKMCPSGRFQFPQCGGRRRSPGLFNLRMNGQRPQKHPPTLQG